MMGGQGALVVEVHKGVQPHGWIIWMPLALEAQHAHLHICGCGWLCFSEQLTDACVAGHTP